MGVSPPADMEAAHRAHRVYDALPDTLGPAVFKDYRDARLLAVWKQRAQAELDVQRQHPAGRTGEGVDRLSNSRAGNGAAHSTGAVGMPTSNGSSAHRRGLGTSVQAPSERAASPEAMDCDQAAGVCLAPSNANFGGASLGIRLRWTWNRTIKCGERSS